MNESAPISALQGSRAWVAAALGWLIPGGGFMFCGRWARGLAHFAMIVATFAIGLSLHSAVVWPPWSIRSEEFNLINNFTFMVQMGSGLPALASFLAALGGYGEVPAGGSPHLLSWLAGSQKHPFYELGSYFLIVAGALNYFAMGNFYDRFVRVQPRFLPQEAVEGGKPSQ